MYSVFADGTAWIDSDGNKEFSLSDAEALAASLDNMGYETEVFPACHNPAHI